MKSILISIKPKWVAKILNGEKTIEIRKTAPKCKLPIDVYIYCTKGEKYEYLTKATDKTFVAGGLFCAQSPRNRKVVAKFTLKEVEECINPYFPECSFVTKTMLYEELLRKGCLTDTEFCKHISRGTYGRVWHISNLEIFDEPKELGNFMKPNWDNGLEKALEKARKEDEKIKERIYYGTAFENEIANCEKLTLEGFELAGRITKAPQSWCYVEELKK